MLTWWHDAGAGRHHPEARRTPAGPSAGTGSAPGCARTPAPRCAAKASGLPNTSAITEWSMTSSAGMSGLILRRVAAQGAASPRAWRPGPPRPGTPVKSCMITRAGLNGISVSGSAAGSQPASAPMWSAVMLRAVLGAQQVLQQHLQAVRAGARSRHRVQPEDLVLARLPTSSVARLPKLFAVIVLSLLARPGWRPDVARIQGSSLQYLDIKLLFNHGTGERFIGPDRTWSSVSRARWRPTGRRR